jgi:DNA-binding response OmpR family regulator
LLLIEDNARLSEYVAVALRGHGFAVDIVDNGADAESAVMATSFDAIVLETKPQFSSSLHGMASRIWFSA